MKPLFTTFQTIGLLMISALVAGCASSIAETAARPSEGLLPPVINPVTAINRSLRELPPPERKIAIAVYGYTDQTGQFKPAETVQSLSRAVTQGATSVLIKALQDAGQGSWFTVVEREHLDNLLKERHIIADMRERYLGEKVTNATALPPLLFAGVLLEGGIIGYDADTKTGGIGARYLGIGGDIKYREDTVTIYLRAISTKSGEVLASSVAHKTIVSVGVQGDAFKYVAIDKILEAEGGFTRNEPGQIAVQQAIEKAVHTLIVEGSARNLWAFADKSYQAHEIQQLREELYNAGAAAPQREKQASAWTAKSVAEAEPPAAQGGADDAPAALPRAKSTQALALASAATPGEPAAAEATDATAAVAQ